MEPLSNSPNGDINLLSRFPISWRFVVKKTLPWFLLVLVINYIYNVVLDPEHPLSRFTSESSEPKLFIVAVVAIIIFLVKLVYTILYRWTVRFNLSGGALILRKGVLIRNEGSYPIKTLTNLGTSRGFLDVLLGLTSVRLATANDASDNFGVLEGLGRRSATELDRYLRSLVSENTTVNFSPEMLQQLAKASGAQSNIG